MGEYIAGDTNTLTVNTGNDDKTSFTWSISFYSAAFYVPFFYLPSKGEIIGLSEGAAAFLLSIVGITNTVGRILCGWLADRPWMNTLHFNNIALIVAGLAILLFPSCNTEGPLAILAAIFGLCAGGKVFLLTE